MFDSDQYELLDFGDGTKIERFGNRTIARESPSVEMFAPKVALSEHEVDASYDSRDSSQCRWHGHSEPGWKVAHGSAIFQLKPTPTGQIGVFPEQAPNWDWITEHAGKIAGKRAINLFAYTGGTTMALAAAGAEVAHIDSAHSVVTWARENAVASGLANHPIRWIPEDAMKFVRREIKRGNTYDILVADPPSFGRGKKKETWQIERDFDELVELTKQLCPSPTMMILSCHTPTWEASELEFLLTRNFPDQASNIESMSLSLKTADNRSLPSGECARFVNAS